MNHVMMLLGVLVQAKDEARPDPAVSITEHFVDTLIHENLALTRVRLTVENRVADLSRELAATIRTPAGAVAYEFDAYGRVTANSQGAYAPHRALSLHFQLSDAARRGEALVRALPVAGKEGLKKDQEVVSDLSLFFSKVYGGLGPAAESGRGALTRVTLVLNKSGDTVSVDTYSSGISTPQPLSPELLQQTGPGRFQLIVFPVSQGGRQRYEMYFASPVRRDAAGLHQWELPMELATGFKIERRLVHVRVCSAETVSDLTCASHPEARRVPHDEHRAELRISEGKELERALPVRVSYRLGGAAKPMDLEKFAVAAPDFPMWNKGSAFELDPVMQPARGYRALQVLHQIQTVMARAVVPRLEREARATDIGVEARLVTPHSSLLLADKLLYAQIRATVPQPEEIPFKSGD